MKAEIRGNQLVVTIDMQPPTPSKSGKTLIVAGQGAVKTEAQIDGKPVTVNLTAWIKK